MSLAKGREAIKLDNANATRGRDRRVIVLGTRGTEIFECGIQIAMLTPATIHESKQPNETARILVLLVDQFAYGISIIP